MQNRASPYCRTTPDRPAGNGETHASLSRGTIISRRGLDIPINAHGVKTVASVVANNADLGVTWIHSYVGEANRKSFCIYHGPSPESIRQVAERNGLPVETSPKCACFDPYFYSPNGGGSNAS